MRKYLILLATALSTLCTLSCKKGEDSIDEKNLYGKWVCTQAKQDGTVLDEVPDVFIIINENGTGSETVISEGDNYTSEITWTLKGKTFTYVTTAKYINGAVQKLEEGDDVPVSGTIKSLSSSKLVVVFKDSFEGKSYTQETTFKKVEEKVQEAQPE